MAAHRIFGETLLDYETQIEAGSVFKDTGPLNRAIADYRHAIETIPVLRTCHSNIGEIYLTKGKLEEAEKAFTDALALPENLEDAFSDVGATPNIQAPKLPQQYTKKPWRRPLITMEMRFVKPPISGPTLPHRTRNPFTRRLRRDDGMGEADHGTLGGDNYRERGDVLNVGFGMAIIDTAIQQSALETHTIIEAHPQVVARAEEATRIKRGSYRPISLARGAKKDRLFRRDLFRHFNATYDPVYARNT